MRQDTFTRDEVLAILDHTLVERTIAEHNNPAVLGTYVEGRVDGKIVALGYGDQPGDSPSTLAMRHKLAREGVVHAVLDICENGWRDLHAVPHA